MSIDEIEVTPLADLTEDEFRHVAQGIAANTTLRLAHSAIMPDLYDAFIDDDDETFLVSRKLTASEAFKYALVISNADNHPLGEFFTDRPFYDRKRAAAGDN